MATRTLVLPGASGGEQVVRFQDGSPSPRSRAMVWLLAAVLLLTGGTTLAALGITPLTGAAPATPRVRRARSVPRAGPTARPVRRTGPPPPPPWTPTTPMT